MTTDTDVSRWEHDGDGVTTQFAYENRIFEAGDLDVYLNGTLQTLSIHYSVTNVGQKAGGVVDFVTPPGAGTKNVVIVSDIAQKQEVDYNELEDFSAEVTETALNRLTRMVHDLQMRIDRAVRLRDELVTTASLLLPAPEAGKVPRWNAAADALENSDLPAFLDGSGAPAGSLGNVDDRYIDNDTGDYYEKTGASSWTLTGNFEGPQGVQGIQGLQGLQGDTGAAGADGVFAEIASQAEAEGGTENTKGMTALRTAQAIAAIPPADNAITNAKLADVATDTIKGRATADTGDPEDLTPAQVRTMINVADGANAYSHPNHSGDVTSSGDGATTIANNAVTNAKAADMAQATLKGRASGAGTGDPTDLTPAQARSILNVADGANAYSHPNHTGDVTSTGDGATVIANNAVTNAKAADMAQATLKGRAAGAGTGDPTDLSAAQARAILNVADGAQVNPDQALIVAVGDETTAITTGSAKITFRMPFAFTLSAVRASLTTAGTTLTTVDINEGGATILSTKLTIDANENTSETAAAAAVISDTALADDAEITIDIDGAGTSAAGLKVTLIGKPT